jgi:hypothetical protein
MRRRPLRCRERQVPRPRFDEQKAGRRETIRRRFFAKGSGHDEPSIRSVEIQASGQAWQPQWLVGSGVEIISDASRRLMDGLNAGSRAFLPTAATIGISLAAALRLPP